MDLNFWFDQFFSHIGKLPLTLTYLIGAILLMTKLNSIGRPAAIGLAGMAVLLLDITLFDLIQSFVYNAISRSDLVRGDSVTTRRVVYAVIGFFSYIPPAIGTALLVAAVISRGRKNA
ncbi:MAG: hypothetical protein U0892_00910 [Pirellulales bacterium]